jgi:putative DNA primase/helicase
MGQLRDGKRGDWLTQHADVVFDAAADCPRWRAFLDEVFEAHPDLPGFIAQAVGYSLTRCTTEQCLFFCYGEGANGKSTFLDTLRSVLGPYGHQLPFACLELFNSKASANSGHQESLAGLQGKRFVSVVETGVEKRLNEALVKALIGNDILRVSFKFGHEFNLEMVSKFWLAFNHKPRVNDDSFGFWRRIRLIPFVRVFDKASADAYLLRKLAGEAPGILNWAIRGCLEWQEAGKLEIPAEVERATEEYRRENDALQLFLDDKCVITSNGRVGTKDLWEAFKDWHKRQSPRPRNLKHKEFEVGLEKRGFEKKRRAALIDHLARQTEAQKASGLLFPTESGKPTLNLDTALRRMWVAAAIKGGHAHRFRDSYAVNLLRQGASIYDVAKLLGITAKVCEEHYSPYCESLQERAAKLVKRNEPQARK